MKAKDKLIRKRDTDTDTELTDSDKPKENHSRKDSVVTSTEMVFRDDNLLMELREPMLDYISWFKLTAHVCAEKALREFWIICENTYVRIHIM